MAVKKVSSTIYELRDLENSDIKKERGQTFSELKQRFKEMISKGGFGPYDSFSVVDSDHKNNGIKEGTRIIAHMQNVKRDGRITSFEINDRTNEMASVYSELRANISISNANDDIPADEYEVYITNDHHGTTVFSIHATEHYISEGFNISSFFLKDKGKQISEKNIKSLASNVGLPDEGFSIQVA